MNLVLPTFSFFLFVLEKNLKYLGQKYKKIKIIFRTILQFLFKCKYRNYF